MDPQNTPRWAIPPTPPPQASGPRPRAGRTIATILSTALLAATIASAGTAAIVLTAAGPAASPGSAAPAASGSPDGSGSPASVTISDSEVVVDVAASASPAVVTITSTGTAGVGPFSVPSSGVGSGFIFDASGLILTNDHVVAGSSQLVVTLKDGRELPATVVETDPDRDLAVIRVAATGLPTIPIGATTDLQVGQLVVAIGSPLGTFTDSVTSGILSATGRTISVQNTTGRGSRTISGLLQTDAAINPGNSGGPLLNSLGQAIGVNTAVASNAEGIGFAVPIDRAAEIMASARTATGIGTTSG